MNKALKQSLKARLRPIAKARNLTFGELWHHLILERFLARLSQSEYKTDFILKGGSLLARYIAIGRETKDLDFLVDGLANTEEPLSRAFEHICSIDLKDGFVFEKVKISELSQPHMDYTGVEILLRVKLGGPQTYLKIDLGFGDIVDIIRHPIELISTTKGPLFESRIHVCCYPKEFIFAEKLETVVDRGSGNSGMKDFHDLYSLISLEGCLDKTYTEKVVTSVFNHRQTSLKQLPLNFDIEAIKILQSHWQKYQRDLSPGQAAIPLPTLIEEVIAAINTWLQYNTQLCTYEISSIGEKEFEERINIQCVYIALRFPKLHKDRIINLTPDEINTLNSSGDHLCVPLSFDKTSQKWRVKYDPNRLYEVVLFYVQGDSGRSFITFNAADKNRTSTKLDRAQLGEIFQVPGYFLNDWNNRVNQSTGNLCYWFQPIETLSPATRKKLIDVAREKRPYNTFD